MNLITDGPKIVEQLLVQLRAINANLTDIALKLDDIRMQTEITSGELIKHG